LSNLPSQPNPVTRADGQWYALSVRVRREQVIKTVLESKGYCVYLPTFRSVRRWSDRIKQIEQPLFPGYVFCELALADSRPPIVTTPGIIGLVSNGNGPAPIPRNEIEAVKKVCASDLTLRQWKRLIPGSTVRIGHGPLAGVEGILIEVNKRLEVVVSIMLLQRSVSVRISPDWVVAAELPAPLHVTPSSERGDYRHTQ
jgi:transcription antitermination factor NusG